MKQYREFLSAQRVLIVDDHSSTRVALARCLSELGLQASQMSLALSFQAAQELISRNRFTIVFSEYELGPRSGIELIRSVPGLGISGIITRNQSDQAMAEAAENDIDIFIRKPFSSNEFKHAVLMAFELRARSHGVDEFSDLHEAIDSIHFVKQAKQVYDRAGYRALASLCDALVDEGKNEDALLVLHRLLKNHPLHSGRLAQVFRLTIATDRFGHIDEYYSLFLKIDEKDEITTREACAALLASGKKSLRQGENERGVDLFQKAIRISGKRAAVVKEVIVSLAEYGLPIEADAMLCSFPRQERATTEFLALDYLVMSKTQPLHQILRRGHELVRAGHSDPAIYEILIQACHRAGHRDEAQTLVAMAARLWPSRLAEYQSLLESPPV